MTIFAALDAAGQPIELVAGQPFHTFYVVVADAQEAAWSGIAIGQVAPFEVSHPATHLTGFGEADFARFCIVRLDEPTPPDGQQLASYSLALDDAGAIMVSPTFEPIPPRALPPEVEMYRVRIVAAQQGLTTAVTNYIASLPEPQHTVANELWASAPSLIVAGDFAQGFKSAQGMSDADFAALIFAAEDLVL